MLKVVLVGAGNVSGHHYRALSRCPEVAIVGLHHPNRESESARRRQREFSLPLVEDYGAVLGDPGVDAVVIASPTVHHAEQALAAARAGKHVLLEKPVALKLAELDALIDARDRYGVQIVPAHNFVYRPVVLRAKEIIASGELGTISYASFRMVHLLSAAEARGFRASHRQAGGGALIDSGMHLAYQSLHLLGRPAKLAAFTARKCLELEDEDVAQVAMQYPDGALGYLFQSWIAAYDDTNEIRVHGSKKSLSIQHGLFLDGRKLAGDDGYEDSFHHLACAFRRTVCEGVPPISTLEDAKAALELVFAAYRSAATSSVLPF